MGLQLAEQFGEENFKAYLLANSKWCKFLMIFCFCATGCCCCLCCCCCFNWCCGTCKPQTPESFEYDNIPVSWNVIDTEQSNCSTFVSSLYSSLFFLLLTTLFVVVVNVSNYFVIDCVQFFKSPHLPVRISKKTKKINLRRDKRLIDKYYIININSRITTRYSTNSWNSNHNMKCSIVAIHKFKARFILLLIN